MENCIKMRRNSEKIDSCICLVYNECNHAGRARNIYSCQFPHIGSFDLFQANEALDKVLTSALIDGLGGRWRHTIIDIWCSFMTSQRLVIKPWVVFSHYYYSYRVQLCNSN